MSTATNNDFTAGQVLQQNGATASVNSPDLLNPYGRGLLVFINMIAAGTGSVTFTIQGKDPGSGTYYTILATAAIVANGFTVLRVYPGLTAVANATVSDVLPRQFRVIATANNANPTNYTVGACVIV